MRMLREAGRGFFCATDEDLQGPPAPTIRYAPFPQAILLAESAQTRCASDPEATTWKKEALYFFPSSMAIYLSREVAIYLSGKAPFIGELSYSDIMRVLRRQRRWFTRPERAVVDSLIDYLTFKTRTLPAGPPMRQNGIPFSDFSD